MDQVIVYKNDDGKVAIVRPTAEFVALIGIDAIAQKDVPAGRPYKIISAADLPSGHNTRDAWEVSDNLLTDGVGADFGAGSDYVVVGYADGQKPVVRRVDFDVSAECGFEEVDNIIYKWWVDKSTGKKMGVPE